MEGKRSFVRHWLGVAACVLTVVFAPIAGATTSVLLADGFNYALFDNPPRALLTLSSVSNITDPPRISGELTLELWAFSVPYAGLDQASYQQNGYRVASYPLGRLAPDSQLLAIDSGLIPASPPPPGTWYLTAMVVE